MAFPSLRALTLWARNGHAIRVQPPKIGLTKRLVEKWITSHDRERSATASMITDLTRALQPLRGRRFQRLLDIGCGFGGLTRLIGECLGICELHGIDLDGRALEEAREKGVVTHHIDVREANLPFPDGYFDLVVSFGMLDYFSFFDEILQEVFRTIRPEGHALISLPNLASWHNRLCLLLGYQPRDVEISRDILAGVHPWYKLDYKNPTSHLRTATAHAFQELMAHHGFRTVGLTGGRPGGRKKPPALVAVDFLLTHRATLARRFFYLGVKLNGVSGTDHPNAAPQLSEGIAPSHRMNPPPK